jgi:hypothetical protein
VSRVPATRDERRLVGEAVARLRTGILAIVMGLVGGTGLGVATAWLTLRGGYNVGQHLGLLRFYFPGYSVTWPGVVVGFGYGVLVGAAVGFVMGTLYNRLAAWRERRR